MHNTQLAWTQALPSLDCAPSAFLFDTLIVEISRPRDPHTLVRLVISASHAPTLPASIETPIALDVTWHVKRVGFLLQ